MPTAEQYIDAGWAAAPAFGLAPETVSLLSHSENVVLRLTLGDDKQVAMRLHRPGYNTIDELRSEVSWVASLARFDVPVPVAVELVDGGHYMAIDVAGEQRYVGVVAWVPGQPIGSWETAAGDDLVDQYRQIGEVAAKIRLHNTAWVEPAGFVRRRWDADGLMGDDPLWGRFWAVDALTTDQADLLAQARRRIHGELGALPVGPERFGLIHADLHLGNVMTDGIGLTIIDFDDAGYGWFAHELAMALHPVMGEPVFTQARQALLEGYRSVTPLDDDEEQLIDTFLVVRSLMVVGWLSARPELPVYELLGDVVKGAVTAASTYLARIG